MIRTASLALNALPCLFCLLCLLFTATFAHAQVSGGLEGKWHHYEVFVEADGIGLAPALDVWIDGDLLAWRERAPLAASDLARPMVWSPQGIVSTPPAEARLSTSAERSTIKPTVSGQTHMIVEQGVMTALLRLRLDAGCAKGCGLVGIDVVELGDRPLALDRPHASPLAMPVGHALPIEPGDVQRTWH